MESLFINEKINEVNLSSSYPNIKLIGIKKLIAMLEGIKDHPRKYELLQALRPAFKYIFNNYKTTLNFAKLERLANNFQYRKFHMDKNTISKISFSIAFISKKSGERYHGFLIFKKFIESIRNYDSYFTIFDQWDFYLKNSKFGDIGIIINALKYK